MLLAIDIGNTNITVGAFDDSVLQFTARLSTDERLTADQYAVQLKSIMELYGQDISCVEDCIVCSVAPQVGSAVCTAVTRLCDVTPLQIGPGIKTGLNIKIDNPAQLGADLVAGAVGAISEYTLPCIVIDMGTATTLSVIDKNGVFLGGSIAAGVRLTLKALSDNTAQLPAISIDAPHSVIGTNTVDSMRAGLVYGAAAMLDGLIDRIEDEMGECATVVATGGLSKNIIAHCRRRIIYNENLLLDGLREIYEKNC
mgnify:CR=1 FL=1